MFRQSLAVAALGVMLASCNSSGSNTVDDALNVTPQPQEQTQEQLAGVPQQDKIQDPRAFCPKTVIRGGTETYDIFPKGVTKETENAKSQLKYRATISEVVRECNRAGGNINIRVGVRGRYLTGPTGEPGSFNMPIRVAITEAGDSVLYSKLHQVPAVIQPGKTVDTFSYVDGEISFPVPATENVIIYVGFDEGPYDTK